MLRSGSYNAIFIYQTSTINIHLFIYLCFFVLMDERHCTCFSKKCLDRVTPLCPAVRLFMQSTPHSFTVLLCLELCTSFCPVSALCTALLISAPLQHYVLLPFPLPRYHRPRSCSYPISVPSLSYPWPLSTSMLCFCSMYNAPFCSLQLSCQPSSRLLRHEDVPEQGQGGNRASGLCPRHHPPEPGRLPTVLI
jgi:hypothetical protein